MATENDTIGNGKRTIYWVYRIECTEKANTAHNSISIFYLSLALAPTAERNIANIKIGITLTGVGGAGRSMPIPSLARIRQMCCHSNMLRRPRPRALHGRTTRTHVFCIVLLSVAPQSNIRVHHQKRSRLSRTRKCRNGKILYYEISPFVSKLPKKCSVHFLPTNGYAISNENLILK